MLALLYILATANAQFQPATAGPTCPGDGSKRVWYACMGQEFRSPTAAETIAGVTVANQVCCTEEFDFECLCCLDFSVPLQRCAAGQTGFCLSRCGAMDLDAANAPPGSPLSMEDDAQVPIPHHAGYGAAAQAPGQIVTVCSKETAVGAMAAQQSGGTPVQLPLQCIPREFTPGEIQGTQPDLETGVGLMPGQAILDERIDFLIQNGIPAADVPTCTKTYAEKGGNGMCPVNSPKPNQMPNSAGADALNRVGGQGYLSTEQEEEAAKIPFLQKKEKMVRRTYGRTFPDLADMTREEVEKIIGETKKIAFTVGEKVVQFKVDQVSAGSSLTLTGEGKKIVVSKQNTLFTDGAETVEIEPSTTVVTLLNKVGMGRRGGAVMSSGSFTLSSGSNTAGNDL